MMAMSSGWREVWIMSGEGDVCEQRVFQPNHPASRPARRRRPGRLRIEGGAVVGAIHIEQHDTIWIDHGRHGAGAASILESRRGVATVPCVTNRLAIRERRLDNHTAAAASAGKHAVAKALCGGGCLVPAIGLRLARERGEPIVD